MNRVFFAQNPKVFEKLSTTRRLHPHTEVERSRHWAMYSNANAEEASDPH
jgi:catalase